jgi:transglutaminase-like putative cysteine protease
MPAYHVIHETEYRYRWPVSLSQQLLHLQPRDMPWQRVHSLSLTVSPLPVQRHNGEDSFGNPCTRLEINQPHTVLNVCAKMHLEVMERPRRMAFEDSPAWEKVVEDCCYHSGPIDPEQLEALRYRQESPYIRIKHVFADYALKSFTPQRPLLEAVEALMSRIHEEFTFDPEATHVATPLTEVLERKRGVCQDFAHLMLACLRALGIPARYVSGYLLTQPPPGQPRLIGADASHAWISVWCPDAGWTDFDPTNDVVPGTEHLTLAWGRDFSDVSPLRGVILGGGDHELDVWVTVMPEAEESPPVAHHRSQPTV